MNILIVVTIGFLIMEASNVLALYFFPGSKNMNSVGIFKAWEKSKSDPEIHNFVKYLVNWVAGAKLIFIFLLIVVLFTAKPDDLPLVAIAMVLSIASFFWRLFPLIRKMDKNDEIEPKGYSTILGWMIGVFIAFFVIATFLSMS